MANNSTNEYLKLLNELRAYNIPKNILDSLSSYLKFIYRSELENHFSAPMLWIGLYIAVASLVCILAMVADLVHGVRSKKLWFPCKYFRINSAFLTIISVAMKLPVDLTGSMPGTVDQVAKLGSMAFMCTMMAHLLPCLATMDDNDLLSNIAALCVLVITLVVNVCIQIQTGVVSIQTYDHRITELVSPRRHVKSIPMAASIRNYTTLHIIYVTLLLVLLVIYVCSSLAVVQSKKAIESEYQKCHHKALQEYLPSRGQLSSFEKLVYHVVKHWIMAGTGSSQFVFTAFFPTTSVAGVICVFVTVLHILTMSWTIEAILAKDYDSDYSWSMILIVIVQFIGVVIGTIVPLSRCFAPFTRLEVMSLKMILDYIKVFKLESYWTRKLYDWKHASIRLRFYNIEMVIETLQRLVLSICIAFQKGVVVVCKIIALVPFFFFLCVLYCFRRLKDFFGVYTFHHDLEDEISQDLLLLKNERLSNRTLKVLLNSVYQLIHNGEKFEFSNSYKFMELIVRCTLDFQGVQKFDQIYSNHVPSTSEVQYYRECWRLSVVTLTTIAVSLPEITEYRVKELLNCVRGGLEYVAIVEENLNVSYDFVRIQKAAETLWQEVDVYHSWLENKLQDPSFHMRTAGQIIEWFEDTANKIVHTMKDKITGDPASGENDDLIHKSICAYSMSRIANKQLLTCCTNSDREVRQQELFDSLTSMIADVIAACLTNLPQVITMKCHTTEIEKREESVKDAAQLLGKTKQIIRTLQRYDIPDMDPSDMPFIEEWRAYFREHQSP